MERNVLVMFYGSLCRCAPIKNVLLTRYIGCTELSKSFYGQFKVVIYGGKFLSKKVVLSHVILTLWGLCIVNCL